MFTSTAIQRSHSMSIWFFVTPPVADTSRRPVVAGNTDRGRTRKPAPAVVTDRTTAPPGHRRRKSTQSGYPRTIHKAVHQHLAAQKQQRTPGPGCAWTPKRGAHWPTSAETAEPRSHSSRADAASPRAPQSADEEADPVHIGFFGLEAIVFVTNQFTHLFQ